MSKLDINRILKLAGVKQLNENGDYDFGHVEPRTHKVEAIPSKPGQANLPVRMINRQGDSPLVDEEDGEPMQGEEPVKPLEQDQICTLLVNGHPHEVTIQYAGKMFITYRDNLTGKTDTVLRSEFEADLNAPAEAEVDEDNWGKPISFQTPSYHQTDDMEMNQNNLEDDPRWNEVNALQAQQQFTAAKELINQIRYDHHMQESIDEGVMDIIHAAVPPETVEKLHQLLAKIGIHDAAILAHDVDLTPAGYTKLAHKLTGEAMSDADAKDYCKHVMHALAQQLEEHVPHVVDESDEMLHEFIGGEHQFNYVTDTMGNVQISDAVTGASVYLQGQDAQEFLGAIEQAGGDEDLEQDIMSQYEHVMDGQLDAEGNEIGLNF
jgi:hypothetical protein